MILLMPENDTTEQKLLEASLLSTIHKLEKTMLSLQKKHVSTTLAEKRLFAHRVGLSVMQEVYHDYSKEALTEARDVLLSLLPSLQKALEKFPSGTPQKTLVRRRLQATQSAIAKIDECIGEYLPQD